MLARQLLLLLFLQLLLPCQARRGALRGAGAGGRALDGAGGRAGEAEWPVPPWIKSQEYGGAFKAMPAPAPLAPPPVPPGGNWYAGGWPPPPPPPPPPPMPPPPPPPPAAAAAAKKL